MGNRIDVPPIVRSKGQFKERINSRREYLQVELRNNAESVGKFQPRVGFETLGMETPICLVATLKGSVGNNL